MKEWKLYKLNDFIHFNPTLSLKKGTIAKKITMDQLIPYSREIYSWVNEPYSGGAKFQNGDTIMARITPCLENGKHAYVSILDNNEIAYGSTEYFVMRGIEGVSDNLFVYYLTHYPEFKNAAIKSMVGSSGRQRAQLDVLKNLEYELPDLDEQIQIATLLSSIDDKIALNKRINDNLEQQAQALYKSWFVDFEPFKDGEFIESELGKIPEGWQCIPFSMFVTESKTKTGKIGIKEYSVTNNGIFPRDAKYNKSLSQSSTKNKLILYGDLVFGMSRDILNWGVMQEEQGGVSSAYTVYNINSGIVNSTYLELFIKSRIHLFSDLIRPAAREGQGIDKSVLQTKVLLYPPQEVLDTFWPLYDSVTNQIQTTTTEINCLGDVRDTLLPKLMSGELKINEIDC